MDASPPTLSASAVRGCYNPLVPCDACNAEVERETLQLTLEGQALCRQCYGIYSSQRATLRARSHDVYRRCTCGTVLPPIGDPEITPWAHDNRSELQLDFFFQPRKYECGSCGTSFRVMHEVMVSLFLIGGSVFVYGGLRAKGDEWVAWLVGTCCFIGFVAYQAYLRIRYPRVVAEG